MDVRSGISVGIFSFLTLLGACQEMSRGGASVLRSDLSKRGNSRIVGGQEVVAGAYPFMASLQDSSGHHYCGASVVGSEWILTAAHCTTGDSPANIRVVVGAHRLSEQEVDPAVQVLHVSEIHIHPEFNSRTLHADFSLLKLKEPIKNAVPIRLDQATSPPWAIGEIVRVMGWGLTSEKAAETSDLLMEVDVPLVAQTRCSHVYPGSVVDSSMLCAGYERGTKDSCQGDSGGPLVARQADGAYTLLGTVSWGWGCARQAQFGVYGSIRYGLAWILSTMGPG